MIDRTRCPSAAFSVRGAATRATRRCARVGGYLWSAPDHGRHARVRPPQSPAQRAVDPRHLGRVPDDHPHRARRIQHLYCSVPFRSDSLGLELVSFHLFSSLSISFHLVSSRFVSTNFFGFTPLRPRAGAEPSRTTVGKA